MYTNNPADHDLQCPQTYTPPFSEPAYQQPVHTDPLQTTQSHAEDTLESTYYQYNDYYAPAPSSALPCQISPLGSFMMPAAPQTATKGSPYTLTPPIQSDFATSINPAVIYKDKISIEAQGRMFYIDRDIWETLIKPSSEFEQNLLSYKNPAQWSEQWLSNTRDFKYRSSCAYGENISTLFAKHYSTIERLGGREIFLKECSKLLHEGYKTLDESNSIPYESKFIHDIVENLLNKSANSNFATNEFSDYINSLITKTSKTRNNLNLLFSLTYHQILIVPLEGITVPPSLLWLIIESCPPAKTPSIFNFSDFWCQLRETSQQHLELIDTDNLCQSTLEEIVDQIFNYNFQNNLLFEILYDKLTTVCQGARIYPGKILNTKNSIQHLINDYKETYIKEPLCTIIINPATDYILNQPPTETNTKSPLNSPSPSPSTAVEKSPNSAPVSPHDNPPPTQITAAPLGLDAPKTPPKMPPPTCPWPLPQTTTTDSPCNLPPQIKPDFATSTEPEAIYKDKIILTTNEKTFHIDRDIWETLIKPSSEFEQNILSNKSPAQWPTRWINHMKDFKNIVAGINGEKISTLFQNHHSTIERIGGRKFFLEEFTKLLHEGYKTLDKRNAIPYEPKSIFDIAEIILNKLSTTNLDKNQFSDYINSLIPKISKIRQNLNVLLGSIAQHSLILPLNGITVPHGLLWLVIESCPPCKTPSRFNFLDFWRRLIETCQNHLTQNTTDTDSLCQSVLQEITNQISSYNFQHDCFSANFYQTLEEIFKNRAIQEFQKLKRSIQDLINEQREKHIKNPLCIIVTKTSTSYILT